MATKAVVAVIEKRLFLYGHCLKAIGSISIPIASSFAFTSFRSARLLIQTAYHDAF